MKMIEKKVEKPILKDKFRFCAACQMVKSGVKSRKTLPHTCNKFNKSIQ